VQANTRKTFTHSFSVQLSFKVLGTFMGNGITATFIVLIKSNEKLVSSHPKVKFSGDE